MDFADSKQHMPKPHKKIIALNGSYMNRHFEPTDYASLFSKIQELEAALQNKTALVRSVIAENAGILLAVDDALSLVVKFAAERGIPADQAEMLPAIKALRTALNIPTTLEVLKTLVGTPGLIDQIAPKEHVEAEAQIAANV